ncbi:MAG: RraA family protein [Bacteroidetes bacterium]|nr:RraA family protein [Bacteroidota bacterium]
MKFNTETELLDYLEKNAYSAAFSDILDEMGYRFQVLSPHSRIYPLKEDFVVIGRAVTLLNENDGNTDEPYDTVIKCIDSIKPDSLLVTTGADKFITGIMGELTATALYARKCRGAIVNGYTRDARKIIKMDFPTFAWGTSPIDTTGRVRVVDYNIPITIGGVKISPDDLIFADLDGIAVIPKAIEEEVINEVIKRINTENVVRKELAEGKTMAEVWSKHHVL